MLSSYAVSVVKREEQGNHVKETGVFCTKKQQHTDYKLKARPMFSAISSHGLSILWPLKSNVLKALCHARNNFKYYYFQGSWLSKS